MVRAGGRARSRGAEGAGEVVGVHDELEDARREVVGQPHHAGRGVDRGVVGVGGDGGDGGLVLRPQPGDRVVAHVPPGLAAARGDGGGVGVRGPEDPAVVERVADSGVLPAPEAR